MSDVKYDVTIHFESRKVTFYNVRDDFSRKVMNAVDNQRTLFLADERGYDYAVNSRRITHVTRSARESTASEST